MSRTTPLEILKAARGLIQDPKSWTQGYMARSSTGRPTGFCDTDAFSWCATGAVCFVSKDALRTRAVAIAALSAEMDDQIGDFNDSHFHNEVLAAFDRAIASLEHQPGPAQAQQADHQARPSLPAAPPLPKTIPMDRQTMCIAGGWASDAVSVARQEFSPKEMLKRYESHSGLCSHHEAVKK